MKKLFLSIIILINVLYCSIKPIVASTYDASYLLEIPNEVIVDNNKSFTIKIKENNLLNSETVAINIDSDFTMIDKYGKSNVNGKILDNQFIITNADSKDLLVRYELGKLTAGNWSSNINISIKLNKSTPSGMLIDGNRINSIIGKLGLKQITFSKDTYTSSYATIDGKQYIDVSENQDNSAILYMSTSTGATISSNGNSNLYANYDCSNMFYGLNTLSKINNLSNLDTSYTTNMSHMFDTCNSITSLDLSGLNVTNVLDMSYLFSDCKKLATISGLSSLNTINITNMAYMFNNTAKFKTGIEDISSLNVTNVTNMSHMFNGLNADNKTSAYQGKLTLDLSNWNMDKVEDLSNFVSNCIYIKELILPSTLSNITNTSNMFYEDLYLDKVNANNMTMNNVTNASGMFYDCRSLVHLGNIINWNMSNVLDASNMFYQAWSIDVYETGNLRNWVLRSDANKDNMFANSSYN